MKTQLDQWAVLAAIVDEGSFQKAARRLHRSQSAVSYAIASLSTQLGVPVLEARGRRSVLTAQGEILLRRARGLVADLERLERIAASLARGWEPELRLVVDAAFPRDALLRVLQGLQGRCPDTQLQLTDAVLSGAEEAIQQGAADLVVTTRVPTGHLGDPLLDVEFVGCAHPAHPLLDPARGSTPLTAEDLARHTQVVVRDSGSASRNEGWLGSRQRYTVGSVEASLSVVSAGLAFAWLPAQVAEPLIRRGELSALPLERGGRRRVTLSLVLPRPESAGPATRLAVECFREAVSE
jgi:DNA-binding transcriptional LysR family regulator